MRVRATQRKWRGGGAPLRAPAVLVCSPPIAPLPTRLPQVLFRILVTLGSSFAVLPLLGIIGAATPDTEATRVWYGLDLFAWALVYGAACWALWPSKARDAFKVRRQRCNSCWQERQQSGCPHPAPAPAAAAATAFQRSDGHAAGLAPRGGRDRLLL